VQNLRVKSWNSERKVRGGESGSISQHSTVGVDSAAGKSGERGPLAVEQESTQAGEEAAWASQLECFKAISWFGARGGGGSNLFVKTIYFQ